MTTAKSDRITRRQFATAVGTAVLSAGVCQTGCKSFKGPGPSPGGEWKLRSAPSRSAKRKPNILIIHCDELRTDCLGLYGNPDIKTTNVDALGADGVRFDNHFCSFPVCTPSRYSLLSGLPVHEHQGWTNYCTLPPGTDTIPRLLKKAGYRTTAVGKMHFTPTYLDVGFERMFLAEQNGPGRWDDDYHRDLRDAGLIDANDVEDQRKEYRDHASQEYWDNCGARPSNLPRKWHSTEWIAERALAEIREWDDNPNMLMLGFIKPHHPFDPPEELARLYDPLKISIPPGWTSECEQHDLAVGPGYFPHQSLNERTLRRVTAYYYATIHHIDLQLGRLVALLKEKKLYDNTLIVFTSDHGEYMGFHHMLLKGNYMYDPLMRIPLLIKYPDSANKGSVYSALTSNTDLAPTLLRSADAPLGSKMTGLDLAKQLDGKPLVFAEAALGSEFMVRSISCKLIQDRTRQRSFYYDLESDPYERVNRYHDPVCRDDIATLEAALAEWTRDVHNPKPYLDENAAEILQPNVPKRNDSHREAMIAYTQEKMTELSSPKK